MVQQFRNSLNSGVATATTVCAMHAHFMKFHVIMKCNAAAVIHCGSSDARLLIAFNNLHKKETDIC